MMGNIFHLESNFKNRFDELEGIWELFLLNFLSIFSRFNWSYFYLLKELYKKPIEMRFEVCL